MYLISLTDRKLYIGYTTNLDHELQEHNSGKVMKYPQQELKRSAPGGHINEGRNRGRTLPRKPSWSPPTLRPPRHRQLSPGRRQPQTIADLGGGKILERCRICTWRASGFDSARLAKDLDFLSEINKTILV